MDNLTLDARQASWAGAALILLIFTAFVAGFFWGQRSAYHEAMSRTAHTAFTDQAHFALYAASAVREPATTEPLRMDIIDTEPEIIGAPESEPLGATPALAPNDATKHVAQLVGFGTKKEAQTALERMKKRGLPVQMRERTSKTPKGRTVTWYQIVSDAYTDKKQLELVLDRICKAERIPRKDVRIYTTKGTPS